MFSTSTHSPAHSTSTDFDRTTAPVAPAAPSTAPSTSPSTSQQVERDPFQIRFDSQRRLPRELREEAMGMSWALFSATFAPAPTVKLSGIEATRSNWCYTTYSADMTRMSKTSAPKTQRMEVTASGPAHAFGAMLAEADRYVEILEFHQIELYEATFTAIKVAHQINERNTAWAVGFGATRETSIAAAMASGAQRIYG